MRWVDCVNIFERVAKDHNVIFSVDTHPRKLGLPKTYKVDGVRLDKMPCSCALLIPIGFKIFTTDKVKKAQIRRTLPKYVVFIPRFYKIDYRVASFFHEIAHIYTKRRKGMLNVQLEFNTWIKGFELMKKYHVEVTDEMKWHAAQCLKGYYRGHYDIIETMRDFIPVKDLPHKEAGKWILKHSMIK